MAEEKFMGLQDGSCVSCVVVVRVSVCTKSVKRTRSRTDHVICGHNICTYFGRVRFGLWWRAKLVNTMQDKQGKPSLD